MKRLSAYLVYLTVAITFLVCRRTVSQDSDPEPAPTGNVVDYEIYSAIIDSDCQSQQTKQYLFVIAPQTIKPFINDWQNVIKSSKLDSVTAKPAWQQFISTLDSSKFNVHAIGGSISSVCYRTQVLTDQKWTYYFNSPSSPGLEGLRKDFPDFSSLLSFSSAVYSTDGTKAVCYRSSVCGGLCGTGEVYFLEKQSTGWRVTSNRLLWIS